MTSTEEDQKKKWNEVWNNISASDWEKISTTAQNIWDNLQGVAKNPECDLEFDNCPMHPGRFFEFSSVIGFNSNNGWSYPEYVTQWWERRGRKYGVPRPIID